MKFQSQNSGWQGYIELKYENLNGATQVIHAQSQAPLKVQRPFYPEGDSVCHSVALHTAGGVVGGDCLTQNIYLGDQSQALITTAAAGKVYRSNGQLATQKINLHLKAGACLEWLPQETIIFNGAIYRQDLRVELEPGASWLGWEITRFGRTARGEKFMKGEWRSRTEVWQQGKPIFIDRQWLPASEEIFQSPHGLAGYPVVASLIWIGQAIPSELLQKARDLWTEGNYSGEAGVTFTLGQGLLCRYRGFSTSEARDWLIKVWGMLRPILLQRPAIKLRIWQ